MCPASLTTPVTALDALPDPGRAVGDEEHLVSGVEADLPRVRQQPRDQWLKGVGGGVFLNLPVVGSVQFDVGHDLRGGVVVHSAAGFGF